jgi:PAS domain S-box-containing protein
MSVRTPLQRSMFGRHDAQRRTNLQTTLKALAMKDTMIPDTKELMWQSLDANGKILSVNDLWLDKMGYALHEVVGWSFSDFLTPRSHPKVKVEFPHLKDYGFVNNVLLELQRRDGVVIEGC